MLQSFRNNTKLQAVVLSLLGILLLIEALFIQVPFWLSACYQRRIQSWRVVLPLDFGTMNTYQVSFQPTESLIGNPMLRMRGPLLSEFNKTHIGGKNIPPHILQESFYKAAIDFKVSWKVLDEDKVFDSGVFGPNDVHAWSYPYYVYYKAEDYSGYRHLDCGKAYSLIVELIKPCEALNKFKPVFTLGPAPMKNYISVARNFLMLTIPLFTLGIVLLIVAALKYKTFNKENTNISQNERY